MRIVLDEGHRLRLEYFTQRANLERVPHLARLACRDQTMIDLGYYMT